jgi:hypothetical protein
VAHEREEKREGGTDRRNQMIRKLIKAGLTELQVRSNSAQMKMGKSRSVGAGHRSRAVLCHPVPTIVGIHVRSSFTHGHLSAAKGSSSTSLAGNPFNLNFLIRLSG